MSFAILSPCQFFCKFCKLTGTRVNFLKQSDGFVFAMKTTLPAVHFPYHPNFSVIFKTTIIIEWIGPWQKLCLMFWRPPNQRVWLLFMAVHHQSNDGWYKTQTAIVIYLTKASFILSTLFLSRAFAAWYRRPRKIRFFCKYR